MDKILIGFQSVPDFSDNAKALYEYLRDHHSDRYDFVWLLNGETKVPYLDEHHIAHIGMTDPDFEQRFSQILVVFETHFRFIHLKRSYQTWIMLWHGLGMKRQGILNEYDLARWAGITHKVDYFITSSELMKVVFAASYDIRADRFLTFGQPRNRYLFETPGRNILEEISGRALVNYDKVLIYLPTFRTVGDRSDGVAHFDNALGLTPYDEAELEEFLSERRYLLVVKMHPSEDSVPQFSATDSVLYLRDSDMVANTVCVNEILNAADMLITDYSSVHADFLLLDRPVLFIHTDKEEYRKSRGVLFEDFDLWFPGPSVTDLDAFEAETERLLSDSTYFQAERLRFNKVVNEDRMDPCKDIAEFLSDILPMDRSTLTRMQDLQAEVSRLKDTVAQLTSGSNGSRSASDLQAELDRVYGSRSWRFASNLARPARRLRHVIG